MVCHLFYRIRVILPIVMLIGLAGQLDAAVISSHYESSPDQPANRKAALASLFEEAVGEGDESRALFARVLSSDNELFARLLDEDQPINFAQAYRQKLVSIRGVFADRDAGGPVRPICIEPADVAALLLLGTAASLREDDPTHRRASFEVYRAEIGEVLTREPWIARLYNSWATSLPDDDTAWRALRRACDLKLREVLPAARFYAACKESSANLRSISIALIGQVGNKHDAGVLLPLLDDGRLPRDENRGFTDPMQVRDFALVTMIQLAGEAPLDFGLSLKPERDWVYTQYGFETDDARNQSIALWRGKAELLTDEPQP